MRIAGCFQLVILETRMIYRVYVYTILTIPYSLIKGATRGTLPLGALEDYQVAHSFIELTLYLT